MDKITEYLSEYDFQKFISDSKTIDAVVRNFEIIGEAAKKIDEQVKSKYPEVPWAEMYYLRNRVTHDYFNVDVEIIWDIALNYLPNNRQQIKSILGKEF
ncbi:MAG TPA: DUF86 domain-containing protein [Ignavibacteria bacterium]|nr:DUF86 domain-containing protein [Ignavibacteria bacterium]